MLIAKHMCVMGIHMIVICFCFHESDTLDCVPYQKQATQHQILYRFLYFRFVLHPNVNVFYDRSVAPDTTVADARFYFFDVRSVAPDTTVADARFYFF